MELGQPDGRRQRKKNEYSFVDLRIGSRNDELNKKLR